MFPWQRRTKCLICVQFIKHFLAEFHKLCTLDLKTTILHRLMCVFPYSSLCRILLSGSINKTTRERLFTSNTLKKRTFQTRKQLSCKKKKRKKKSSYLYARDVYASMENLHVHAYHKSLHICPYVYAS